MKALLRDYYLRFAGSYKNIKPGVHIINSHYVNPSVHHRDLDYIIFENFLKYLQEKTTFLKVEEAVNLLENKKIPTSEATISFTFDDGFEECYTVIAPLLEKYGTRGAFFINANYIDSDQNYQTKFNERINTFTKKPMSWEQIKDLHRRGHLIGSHNLDHTNFGELDLAEITEQLETNKQILEEKLNYRCDYFAWTYGQFKHFPKEALIETKKFHSYIFSATNFKNYFSFDGAVINRRHLEANWRHSHIKFFLSFKKTKNI